MYPGIWAQRNPDKPAYVMASTGRTVTYRELDEGSNRLAHYWRSHGLRAGDHVAIVMENNARYLEVMWAALRSGLIFTPVNIHLLPHELAYIVENCGAKSVVTSARFAPALMPAIQSIPNVESRLVLGVEEPGFSNYESAVAPCPPTPISDEALGADLHYTSGTTGRPKGGTQPLPGGHPATTPSPLAPFFASFGLTEDSVYLSPGGPLYHAAPGRFAQAATAAGATSIIYDDFDAATALRAIDAYDVTHSQWVPTMFVRLLRLPEEVRRQHRGKSHRAAIHGAAPCPVWAKHQMIEWWGPILFEYYGASEGGSTTVINSEEWLAHPGSVGKATLGTVHIVDDETGRELAPGRVGTVRFRCEQRPVRYHLDDEKNRAAHDDQGRSTVGDVGYVDEEGYLYLTDRKHDTIISGGVNIYPQEAENVLLQHPVVADAAVFGVPDLEYGEQVKAAIELIDPSLAGHDTEAALIEYCRAHLASYKCPRSVDFEPKLPRTPAGKLYKRLLKERYHDARKVTMTEPDRATQVSMYEIMTTIKQCDERLRAMLMSGQAAFMYYSPRGQEVISAAVAVNLDPTDYVVTTYRGIHDQLAKGVPLNELWAELFGKATGCCKGKGGPMHITHAASGLMVTTGVVGGGLPIANGLALASQMKTDGRVTVVNFGDGAVNIGAFHESLNMAQLWRLPVVFVCQNNLYGEHTALADHMVNTNISERAAGYGMAGVTVDGNDPSAMCQAAAEAIDRARRGDGPTLIEAMTYRFFGHYFGDSIDYMPKEEYEAALAADPVPAFRARLIADGTASEEELATIEKRIESALDDAVEFANSSPYPDLAEIGLDVYAEEVAL